jgi:aldehyde:ferredoxin oxidoreductase
MKDLSTKNILTIDLAKQTVEVKNMPDLKRYIGGVGLGLKLLSMYSNADPMIFSIGPLNGFFPYCSKTSVIIDDKGVAEDLYIGGSLSTRLAFCGIDSIMFLNKSPTPVVLDIHNTEVSFKNGDIDISSLGLPGKRCVLKRSDNTVLLGNYFGAPENYLGSEFVEKNINGVVITGSEVYKPSDFSRYTQIYQNILARREDLTISKSGNPSCTGCPQGCTQSKSGELGGNILVHSLVACQYSEKIYSDVGIVFSCLNVLGYDYTHEEIEDLPILIEKTLKSLN